MSYQDQDLGLFDYRMCDPAESAPFGVSIPLRRPLPTGPGYLACIGAAQTYGRYVDHTWGHRLGERLGREALLLAKGGTGPEYWIDKQPEMVRHLDRASVAIVQVMSARSVSSSLAPTPEWVEIARKRINRLIEEGRRKRLELYIRESQENYVLHMTRLLDAIPIPKVLFWFSERTPQWSPEFGSAGKLWGLFPHMVDPAMIEALKPHANAYVECISSAGLPADLGTDAKGRKRRNRYYPTQQMHDLAVEALAPVVGSLL